MPSQPRCPVHPLPFGHSPRRISRCGAAPAASPRRRAPPSTSVSHPDFFSVFNFLPASCFFFVCLLAIYSEIQERRAGTTRCLSTDLRGKGARSRSAGAGGSRCSASRHRAGRAGLRRYLGCGGAGSPHRGRAEERERAAAAPATRRGCRSVSAAVFWGDSSVFSRKTHSPCEAFSSGAAVR